MDLELESEYFRNKFSGDEFTLAPFKKEVCLGISFHDDSYSELLIDAFWDMGLEVFDQRNEPLSKLFFALMLDDSLEYISLFFYIGEEEIMSFSVPMEYNSEKLLETVKPVFKNFWETHFEEIIEVRRYNRGIVEKLSQKNSAYAFQLLYMYYRKIEMDSTNRKFFWLKKWASRSSVGRKRLLKYYRQHHEYSKAEKLSWLSQGENKRDNF